MADILNGSFIITSSTDGNPPVGVNPTLPAWQFVYFNAPVNDCMIQQVGKSRYQLSIGGYRYTGVRDGKVIASLNVDDNKEWIITRREDNTYTIALASDDFLGWTIPIGPEETPEVVIRPIIATPSFPPHFLASQLFFIKRND